MKISSIYIQNFRKLQQCRIDFSEKTTLFVGAKNSGKTSAMDVLGKFLAGRSLVFNDLTISNRTLINAIGEEWVNKESKMPDDLMKWDHLLPMMDVWLEVERNEIHYVASIIPILKWRGGEIGIRLAFQPKDVSKLFTEYINTFSMARSTETARKETGTTETSNNTTYVDEKSSIKTLPCCSEVKGLHYQTRRTGGGNDR